MTLWWREVWCPYCQAAPGENCHTKSGRITYAHADRHRDGEYYMLGGFDEFEDEFDLEDYINDPIQPPPYRTMINVYLPGDAPSDRITAS